MTEKILQAATTFLVATLSFLGWKTDEYLKYLTPKIQQEIEKVSLAVNKETPPVVKKESPIVSTKPKAGLQIQKPLPKTETLKPAQNVQAPKITPVVKIQIPTITLPPKPSPAVEAPVINLPPATTPATAKKSYADSLANIYCTIYRLPYIETITGSAVSVEEENVYLTNAHLGIFVLLQNTGQGGKISCLIREGAPAKKLSPPGRYG